MLIKSFNSLTARDDGSFILTTNCAATARLWFLSDDIVRLRVSFDNKYAEHSYALITTAWDDELDDLLSGERRRVEPLRPQYQETAEGFVFTTATMQLTLGRSGSLVTLRDKDGKVFYSSLENRSFEQDHLGRVLHYSTADYEHDHYYGFGEASGPLDKKGRHIRLCPRDSIGLDAANGMPMYKHIPFYLKASAPDFHCLGLFYNSPYDAVFDLGNERSGYWSRYSYYCADGGDIDLFLINGPDPASVVKRYTYLTGTTALVPRHALGFTMSTMYYAELEQDCDQEIYRVMDEFAALNLPVDNFWLASGYSSGEQDNLRYTFNWNYRRFPNPDEFCACMQERGVNVIPNLKPGVLTTHPYLQYYQERQALIKDASGEHDYLGTWWGGPGYFVDFTSPSGRNAWKELLKQNILSHGFTTVWNDNNEMDGVEDRLAQVSAEGRGGTMVEYKAVQANMMAYTAHEALAEYCPQVRPYVISRAGFAGIQRYAQVWGGDNLTSWTTLRCNVALILGMGLSGCADMGCDIGGFTGPCPDPELLLRWIQNGIFQPRFVMNSANTDNTVTQPFMYPQIVDEVREAFLMREELMPYWYSLLHEAHETGAPIVRPLFYEFPDDPACYSDDHYTFMFGRSLLIANVLEQGARTREVYLPRGCRWWLLEEPRQVYEGGQTIAIAVNLSSIPIFVREECILPCCHLTMAEELPEEEAEESPALLGTSGLYISTRGEEQSFVLYEDDGWSNAWRDGEFRRTTITVRGSRRVQIDFETTGSFVPPQEAEGDTLQLLHFYSHEKGANYVSLNGRRLTRYLIDRLFAEAEEGWYYDAQNHLIEVKYQRPQDSAWSLVVSTEPFDLIGMENTKDQ